MSRWMGYGGFLHLHERAVSTRLSANMKSCGTRRDVDRTIPGSIAPFLIQDRSGRHSRPWRIRAVSFETLIQKVLLQRETFDHCGSRAFKATACPAGKVQYPVSGLAAGSGGSRTLLAGSGTHFSGSGGLWTGSGRSSSLWMSGDRPWCRRSDGNGQRGRDRSVLSMPDSGRSARGDRPV